MKPVLKIYSKKEILAERLALDFVAHLSLLIRTGKTVYIALSGGSTPSLFFAAMREMKPDINWEKVRFFWVDERCVPPDHPESNYGVARKEFIEPLGIPPESCFRMMGENNPEQEAHRYSELILDLVAPEMNFPVFDWIFLGMGSDGHTASIFPDQIDLWNYEEKLCTVGIHPESGQQRVSFAGPLINAANRVSFLVTGKEKRAVVKSILTKDQQSEKYPASLVAPYHGELEWYMDEAAGKDFS